MGGMKTELGQINKRNGSNYITTASTETNEFLRDIQGSKNDLVTTELSMGKEMIRAMYQPPNTALEMRSQCQIGWLICTTVLVYKCYR
jgi:hypothetical protein